MLNAVLFLHEAKHTLLFDILQFVESSDRDRINKRIDVLNTCKQVRLCNMLYGPRDISYKSSHII